MDFKVEPAVSSASAGKRTSTPRQYIFVNEEKLITAVRQYPILYDRTLKGYKRPADRENVWREISRNISFPVNECKKRWRSLRDAFMKQRRYLTNPESLPRSSGTGKRKTWLYFDQMQFLIPFIYQNKMIDECDSDDGSSYTKIEETNNPSTLKIEEFIDDTVNECAYFDESDAIVESQVEEDSADDSVNTIKPTQKTQEKTVTQMVTGNHVERLVETDSYASSFDDNEKFLLSCAPTLRRLSRRKNSLARLKILKTLYEIEFDESSCTEDGGNTETERCPQPSSKKFKRSVYNSQDRII